MKDRKVGRQSINSIKENLKRLEEQIRGPYARPADIATRDRLARRLRDAMEIQEAS